VKSLEELLAALSPEQQADLLARLDGPAGASPEISEAGAAAAAGSAADRADRAAGPGRPVIRRAGAMQAPLSFGQRGLWFLHKLRPESTAYHISHLIGWPGPVDAAALSAALDDLAARHEVLRTRFPVIGGEPRQLILPALHVPLAQADLGEADPREWARAALRAPFDVATGPLIRAALLRSGSRHTVVLTVHHIVFDAWSMEVLLRELTTMYRARAAGQAAALPPLPIQYADFAAWQRAELTGPALAELTAYWRGQLAGSREPLALPADHRRTAAPRTAGATHRFTFPGELARVLAGLARQHGTTMFVVLLAGFQVLLHRYTGRDDIAVGAPVASRNLPETEGLIGYFLNTLVLRADLSGDPSFGAALDRVAGTVLDAMDHQDMPFDLLVEELAPQRAAGTLPLVPVLFAFSVRHPGGADGPVARPVDTGSARADLTLAIEECDGELRGAAEYDLGLFRPDTISRLCGHLTSLLTAAATDPQTAISRLPLLTAAERDALAGWNATARPEPAGSVAGAILAQAARTPAATAVRAGDLTVSYRQLDERSARLAGRLRAAGIGPGDPVGVLLPRGADLVIALVAVLRSGGAYLPLDPAYPAGRLGFMLADAGAKAVISHRALAQPLPAGRATLFLDDPDGGAGPADAAGPGGAADRPPHPDQAAYIIYTSGSTGQPKGVVNCHRGLASHMHWMLERYAPGPADVIVHKTPAGFDVSLWELLLPLMSGAEMVVARPDGHRDPAYLADLVERHGATMIHFVPSMLRAFLAAADLSRCGSLRAVLCSGEALPADLRDRFDACGLTARLDNLYGPSEAAIHVTAWSCGPGDAGEVPIGQPVPNTTAYVLDRRGAQLPVGVPGELGIGGAHVAAGYLGRPGLTAASFRPDPFAPGGGARLYRTGDIAARRPDGALDYLGRADQQVKLRGYRIELGEIEAALAGCAGISDAAVLLSGDGKAGPQLVAYLVAGDQAPSDPELRERLARSLPVFMIPAAFIRIAAMPLSANGKADRDGLRRIEPAAAAASYYTEPAGGIEAAVAAAIGEVLGLERVSATADFFDLGGHSLLALRLLALVQADFGVELALSEVFEDPTVQGVSGKIIRQLMDLVGPDELARLLGPQTVTRES
jgi:amino acid adenylation domain-containing protein